MRAKSLAFALVILPVAWIAVTRARMDTRPASPARPAARPGPAVDAIGSLPLAFEVNEGQADPRVRFLARGRGQALLLARNEAILVLQTTRPSGGAASLRDGARREPEEGRARLVRMRLLGSNPRPGMTGLDELPGRSHYLVGSDPGRWRRGVRRYARVRSEEVYPGVDLIFHGSEGRLEYDLVVAPGADPGAIRIGFEGSDRLRLDANGSLILSVGDGELVQPAPRIYQQIAGVRSIVPGRFVLRDAREVGFAISGMYDAARPLVIDPVLSYSTYLSGSGSDSAWAIAVDGTGSVYVTGETFSTDFPLERPMQATRAGDPTIQSSDAFVTKLDPSGGSLVWSTYLGGSRRDGGAGIAIDGSGSAYVTGYSHSLDFPVVGPFQPQKAGGSGNTDPDVFVSRLTPDGSALVYSTYLGGSGTDAGSRIAIDSSGGACVTGYTHSADFPLANPLQPRMENDDQYYPDAFVTKLAPAGNALEYSSFLGGHRDDYATGVAIDPAGIIYVSGYTSSADFPTVRAWREASSPMSQDAFVAKLDPSGPRFVYSTLLGGSGQDQGHGIAADAAGNAYVIGFTASRDFPVLNPAQGSWAGRPGFIGDAFATKIDPEGASLVYSTFLGGGDADWAMGVAVDAEGQAHVTGYTSSSDFPQTRPLDSTRIPSFHHDVFVTKLSADGRQLAYSTCLGGTYSDDGTSVAVDASGAAYVAGWTWSRDFPTTAGAFQPASTNTSPTSYIPQPFILKITDDAPAPGPAPLPGGGRVEQTDPAIQYKGDWTPNGQAGHGGGGAVFTADAEARAVVTFRGTGIRWIAYRDEWSGLARVYLDGVFRETVDTYASPARYQDAVYSVEGLGNGVHTLVVDVPGSHGPESGGSWIWIDAFDVTGPPDPYPTPTPTPSPTPTPTPPPDPGAGRVEDSDVVAIAYSGGWGTNANSLHSGGTAALSMDAGARATLTFDGTGVRWIALRDDWSGIASVYLDGAFAGTVDTYAASFEAQGVAYEAAGLAPGTHTLAIEVTGRRNTDSSGSWIWIDAFDIECTTTP